MERGPHRNAVIVAIDRMLAERGIANEHGEPVQLDLFATPAEARLFKRRRGRPPSARAKPKWRHRKSLD
jgi:hypothetical protein